MEVERLAPKELPEELRLRNQWVVWRLETRHGKPAKVPYRPDPRGLRRASSTDPRTWGALEEAVRARDRRPELAGIGFVLAAEDPVVGVDLDRARDPQTGALEPWAAALVSRLSSYAELSPSLTGVHVLALGSLPPGGRKRGPVEVYDSERFFTVTGLHLVSTPRRLEARRAELAAMHAELLAARPSVTGAPTPRSRGRASVELGDAALLERAFAGRNGGRLRALFAGEWEALGYPSQSEADLALCNGLFFYTGGDRERTDALFRRSGLHRPKWDERRGGNGRTYGERTLDLVERTQVVLARR